MKKISLFIAALVFWAVCAVVVSSTALADVSISQPNFGEEKPVTESDQPPSNYRLTEEDVLRIDVLGEPALSNQQARITPDGNIDIGFLGTIKASGLTIPELHYLIVKKLAESELVYNSQVQVTLLTIHDRIVRVLGEVHKPGASTFKEGDRLMDALAQAGSVTDNAWREKATISRKGVAEPIPVDVKKLLEGDMTQNIPLQNGDTIYIPPEDYANKIYVLGQVNRPGLYDLKDKTTVLQAISVAGGVTERGALRRTVVVRGDPQNPNRVPINLSKLLDKGDLSADLVLEPGDCVLVPETKTPNLNKISQFVSTILNVFYLRRYARF